MATIENFILKFKVEGAAGLKSLQDGMQNLTKSASGVGGALNGVVGAMGGIAGVATLAGGAFAALGMKVINLADEIQDMADATGIGADQLLGLRNSMLEAGGNSESMSKAVAKLSVAIGESMGGNEKYQKSFKDLGIIIRDSNGQIRDSGDILSDTLAALAAIEDPAVRSAKAVELFGKEAAKLDLTKLSAPKDLASKEQIEALAKYRGEIDKLKNSIDNALISAFGKLAIAINSIDWTKQKEKIGDYMKSLGAMLPMMKMASIGLEASVAQDKQAALMAPYKSRAGIGRETAKPTGDQGGLSEQALKAIEDSKLRITNSGIEARKQLELKAATDIQAIEINARYETEKAMNEISARERLSPTQIAEEQAAKKKEIAAKAATDVAKIEKQVAEELDRNLAKSRLEASRLSALTTSDEVKNIQINAANDIAKAEIEINARKNMSKEQQELELAARTQEINAKAAYDTLKLRDAAAKSATEQVTALQKTTEELQGRFQLEQGLLDLSTREQERLRAIFEVEKERKAQLEAISKIPNLAPDARLAKEKELNKTIEDRIDLVNQEAKARLDRENDFSAGIKESMKRYEESMTPLKQGQQVADSVFNNMTSALDKFVETGKFSFGDLTRSIIMDLLKIQLKAAATQLFNSVLGTFGFGLPGLATGGPVMPNQAYIVGEKGPEVFLPNSAGTIIPNNKLGGQNTPMGGGGTTIINNISAIDSRSVAQLFAENRMTLLGTVEQARRELPLRTR